jgi:hypothetical protein
MNAFTSSKFLRPLDALYDGFFSEFILSSFRIITRPAAGVILDAVLHDSYARLQGSRRYADLGAGVPCVVDPGSFHIRARSLRG